VTWAFRRPSAGWSRRVAVRDYGLGHEAHAGVVVGRVEPCPEGAELW